MITKEILGFVSIAFGVVGYASYIRSIFQRHTKPHMFSWIIWGTVSGIAFFAQISKHGGAGAWAIGASAAVCYFIGVVAFFRGEKNINKGDWVCLTGALAAIPLWYVTDEPLWSVILVVVIDVLGFYPTLRKSYAKPFEESALIYGLDTGKFILSLFALEAYSLTAVLYPLTAMTLDSVFVVVLLVRRAALGRLTK